MEPEVEEGDVSTGGGNLEIVVGADDYVMEKRALSEESSSKRMKFADMGSNVDVISISSEIMNQLRKMMWIYWCHVVMTP